ncbi:13830_t:CDS:2 [Entrophospora sp. SA101]|nr:13830_t:CDS:2 [Entrophospora sp. SA101]CAJ0927158.1 17981_t:CDS:2 [Entrophospora sp. SA101]
MSLNKSDQKKKEETLPETEESIKANNQLQNQQDQQKSINETPPSSNIDNTGNKLASSSMATSVVNNNDDSSTLDKSKSILLNNNKNYVIKIKEIEQVPDENSIFDENLNNPNIIRKLSNAEEDVCYPIRPLNKKEGIDFEALEEYIREENALMAKKKNNINNNDDETKATSLKRRVSQYAERIKPPPDLTEALRFTFYSTETGTIRTNCFSEIPPKGQTMTELLKQGYFWIDVLSPTDSEMRILSSIFHIHPLTTEDIETEESREKCELFKNYYFINFRSYNQNNCNPSDDIEPISMFNVVMREGILSDYIKVTPDWINYALIDDITDSFAPLIRQVEFQSDAIDQLVLVLKNSEQQDMLVRIGICRKMVMTFLKLLGTKADVIKALIKRCEEINAAGGEKNDHIITMLQNLNHYELILSRAHSNYLAQISIEITQLSNKTNEIINKLTVFATVLVPMNVVTGLFGMNVKVPGQDEDDLIWFFSIVGALTLFGLISYFIIMRIQKSLT